MKVDATSIQPSAMAQSHSNRRLKGQSATATGPAEKRAETTETARQQPQAKGVMRLLQEGHFKGVAALRLRINFFDQVSELEQSNLQETARQGITELARTMEDGIGALNSAGVFEEEPLSQAKELADTFISELQAAVEEDGIDPQSTVSALEQAFSAFEAAVADLLLPSRQTPEPDAGNPAEDLVLSSTEPAAETAPSELAAVESDSRIVLEAESAVPPAAESDSGDELRAGFDELAATFRSQLSSLQDGLQNNSLLSGPEPPDSQGAAYQKFLAIYRQMQGVTTVGEAQPNSAEPATEV